MAEHAAEPEFDPAHHVMDKVLVGIDKNSDATIWKPYGDHGHVVAGYVPRQVGPFKLEFTKHMFGLTVTAVLIAAVGIIVSRRVMAGLRANKAPSGRLANAVEGLLVFIRDEMVTPVGGHHLGHYTPLFLTYFLFILTCNLMGLIPEYGTSTGNFGVTLALGGSIYLLIWILGIFNQGPFKYLIHLVPAGIPFWLWPLMFILELVGPIIKCFVLAVRLFANMMAGHLVIGSILKLGALSTGMLIVGVPLALSLSFLEIMVCFIQAYVFTMLSIMFVGAAVHPEH